MDIIEILVYIYAGLFVFTFGVLIGLFGWMYNLSKQVKIKGRKNPYEAFMGTPPTLKSQEPPISAGAVDLYKDYKMKRAQLRSESENAVNRRNSLNSQQSFQNAGSSHLRAPKVMPNQSFLSNNQNGYQKRSQLEKLSAHDFLSNSYDQNPPFSSKNHDSSNNKRLPNARDNFDMFSY